MLYLSQSMLRIAPGWRIVPGWWIVPVRRNVPDGKERHYGCDWRNHGAPSASDCAGGGQRAGDSH